MPSFLPRRLSRHQPRNSVETQSHSPPTETIVASSSTTTVNIPPSPSVVRLVSGVEFEMATEQSNAARRRSRSTPNLNTFAGGSPGRASAPTGAKGTETGNGTRHARYPSGESSSSISKIARPSQTESPRSGTSISSPNASTTGSPTLKGRPRAMSVSSNGSTFSGRGVVTRIGPSTPITHTVVSSSSSTSALPAQPPPRLTPSLQSRQKETTRSRIAKLTRKLSSSSSLGSRSQPTSPSMSKVTEGTTSRSSSPITSPTSTSRIPKPPVSSSSSPIAKREKMEARPSVSTSIERSSPAANIGARTSAIPPPQYGTKTMNRTTTPPAARSTPQLSSSMSPTIASSPTRIPTTTTTSASSPSRRRFKSPSSTDLLSSPPTSPTITRHASSFFTPVHAASLGNTPGNRSSSHHLQFNPAPPLAAGRLSPAMTSRETFAGFSDLPETPHEEASGSALLGGGRDPEVAGGARANLMGLGVVISKREDVGRDEEGAGGTAAGVVRSGAWDESASPSHFPLPPHRDDASGSNGSGSGEEVVAGTNERIRTEETIVSSGIGKRVTSGSWLSGMMLGGPASNDKNNSKASTSAEGVESDLKLNKQASPPTQPRPGSDADTSSSHRSDRFPSIIGTPTKPSASAPTASLVTATARDVITCSPLAPALDAFEGSTSTNAERVSRIPGPRSPGAVNVVGTSSPVTRYVSKGAEIQAVPTSSSDKRASTPSRIARKKIESKPATPTPGSPSRVLNMVRQDAARAMSPGGEDVPIESEQDPRSIVSANVLASSSVRPGIEDTLAPIDAEDEVAILVDTAAQLSPSPEEAIIEENATAAKPFLIRKPTAYSSFISQTSPGPPVAGGSPVWAGKSHATDSQTSDHGRRMTASHTAPEEANTAPAKSLNLREVVNALAQVITPNVGRTPSPPLTPPQTMRRSSFLTPVEPNSPSPVAKSPKSAFPFTGLFAAPGETEQFKEDDLAPGKINDTHQQGTLSQASGPIAASHLGEGQAPVRDQASKEDSSSKSTGQPKAVSFVAESLAETKDQVEASEKSLGQPSEEIGAVSPLQRDALEGSGKVPIRNETELSRSSGDLEQSEAVSPKAETMPKEVDVGRSTEEDAAAEQSAVGTTGSQTVQPGSQRDMSALSIVSLESEQISRPPTSSSGAVTVYTTPFCLPNISVASPRQTSSSGTTGIIAGLLRPRVAIDVKWKGALLPSEIAINGDRGENTRLSEERRKRSSLMLPIDVGVAAARIPLNVGRAAARAPVDISYAAASYAYSFVPGWKVVA